MAFPTLTVTAGTGQTINTLPAAGQATAAESLSVVLASNAGLPAGTAIIGKVGIDQTTPGTTNGASLVASILGGATPFKLVSAATVNATLVKGAAGKLMSLTAWNLNAAVRYLKIYNKATAPSEADTPVYVIPIPASATGNGTVVALPPEGAAFALGIGYRVTTGAADADVAAVAANEIFVAGTYN